MDRSDVIKLISVTRAKNSKGIYVETETETQVFCSVRSVSASEFFNANEGGLKPEYQFTLFRYEYNNEETLEYNGVRYSIYRTYIGQNDTIELYVQKDVGS